MKKNSQTTARSLSRSLCAGLLVLFVGMPLLAPSSVNAGAHRYRLRINNNSRYDIHRIYVSSAESSRWGHDLLGDGILSSYGAFTITDIVPGEWDIKFVDEDGDVCVLRNVKVFQDLSWSLTTAWLVDCQRSSGCHCSYYGS